MTMSTVMSRQEVDETTLAEVSKACNVSVEQIEDIYACTPLQIATAVESSIHTGAGVFRFVLALSPLIDIDCFVIALRQVVTLNSVLRTRVVNCSHGMLQVVINESHCTQRPSGNVEQYLRTDKALPLGLGTPLIRTAIIDRKLILSMHHAIMDHASLTPLFEDVLNVYYGREPMKRAEFKEFVPHCLDIDESIARPFWESRFKGTPAIFPKVEPGYVPLATNIVNRTVTLDRMGTEVLAAHIPSFIEAAWALTVSTYTGSESIAYGLVLSGRNSSVVAENTLGPTIAVVPAQVTLQRSMTVEGILKDRAAARRQLQTHPALQYGLTRIRTVSEAAGIASGFQTLLNIRPRWYDPEDSSDITYDDMDEPHGAFALCLSCDLQDTAVLVEAVYDPDVVCAGQLDRTLRQFEHYLQSLIKAPTQAKLIQILRLNSHDLSEIIAWNNAAPQTTTGSKCVHELFRARAQERPTAAAVDAHDGTASYDELDQLSDRLAQELRKRGVSAESPVAFIFEKSIWTVVSLLGIMKASGTCVPIAPFDPPARKASIISKAGANMVLTSSAQYTNSLDLAPDVFAVSAESMSGLPDITSSLDRGYFPNNLAYILFTSGTTGLPKGVKLEHKNLTSSLASLAQRLDWNSGSRMLQFASHVWDASIGEIFGALLSGGCICIPSEEARVSYLASYIESTKINCAWLTPTVIRTLTPDDVPGLQSLVSIGEMISPEISKTWGKNLRLFNGYGPCESSIISIVTELTPGSLYPEAIGTPVNCGIWIVNSKNVNELVPIGAVGEILIAGPGVARGYLKDDVKTKASFIKPPPWAASCEGKERHLYRTGDLAKYNTNGTICFVGRQDSQVKIRGQRLELGEIESMLSSCGDVRDIFITTKISNGRTELVAVVCLADSVLPGEGILHGLPVEYTEVSVRLLRSIRDYARSRLSSYMIPTIWLAVERMPKTESEKLDRVSIGQWLKKIDLPSAKASLDAESTIVVTPPHTKEERLLQSVWSSVLSIPKKDIGRENYFIQLGGDSILATRATSQCLKLGLRIPTTAFLKFTTLAAIAELSTKTSCTAPDVEALSRLPSQNASIAENVAVKLNMLNPHVTSENIDTIIPSTDGQATMIAVGETGGRGYYINFKLSFTPSLDITRLQNACEQVIKHHSILRTVFVSNGPTLYQVILKNLPPTIVIEEADQLTSKTSFQEGATLACFHLISDSQRCERIHFEIHHALYDAVSLGLIFRDLDAAYTGRPLSDSPDFRSWVSHTDSLDKSAAREFWKGVLEGTSMPYLVPPVPGAVRGHPLGDQTKFQVGLQNLQSPFGTPSSVIKAAWSLLLFIALGNRDTVFGEVSANRYLEFPGIDQVRGPCVNLVPFKARIDSSMSLASLVTQIHDSSIAGIPYHHLGTNSIIQDCTPWPRWTRFSTAVVYQNHDSLHNTFKLGDADVALSSVGKLGDSTDIHLIVTPGSEDVDIELRHSSKTFPPEQVQWIAQALAIILQLFPSKFEEKISQVETSVENAIGSYKVPPSCTTIVPPIDLPKNNPRSPTEQALRIVLQTWQETGITLKIQNNEVSLWDCGANVVTALLLSEHYRASGYNITAKDIIQNPSQLQQACFVDSLIQA